MVSPFALRCFTAPPVGLAVEGSVQRSGVGRGNQPGAPGGEPSGDASDDWLRLRYRLIDPQGLVRIPSPSATPQRCDGLWEHTCLEAFLAEPGAERYWEVNLAPSGDWNVYRLSAYRQGLTPEAAISALPMQVSRRADGLDLEVALDLEALPLVGRPLQLGITAVLELQGGDILYWALLHPAEQADFHLRSGFGLRV